MVDQSRVLLSARDPANLRKWHLGNQRLVQITLGGGAIAVVMGLLSAESFFSAAADLRAGVDSLSASRATVAAPEPATFDIVPASINGTESFVFFGTGDHSAGFYSKRSTP